MHLVEIIGIIASLATGLQMHYWFGYARLVNNQKPIEGHQNPDVLICAHNDLAALQANLPVVLQKTTTRVIVIDHGSTDGSFQFLQKMAVKEDRLDAFRIERTFPGKKEALAYGLNQVESDFVLLSDADCAPRTDEWVPLMVSSLKEGAIASVGISPLTGGGNLIAKFAEYDALLTAYVYARQTQLGLPYMAVGRNLLLQTEHAREHVTLEHGGPVGGDDDLTINALKRLGPISICTDPASITTSRSPQNLRTLLGQRRRHVGTAHSYDFVTKYVLTILTASHWLHYMTIFLLLCLGGWLIGLMLWLVRLAVVYAVFWRTGMPWHGRSLLLWIPLLDMFYVLFYPAIAILLVLKPKQRW